MSDHWLQPDGRDVYCVSEVVSFIDSSRKLVERLEGCGWEWKIQHCFAGLELAIWGFWLVSLLSHVRLSGHLAYPPHTIGKWDTIYIVGEPRHREAKLLLPRSCWTTVAEQEIEPWSSKSHPILLLPLSLSICVALSHTGDGFPFHGPCLVARTVWLSPGMGPGEPP